MSKMMHKKRMSRKQFESLFAGKWEEMRNGMYRKNGKYETTTKDGWKIFKFGSNQGYAVRAKTWREIAKTLKLIP